MKINTVKHTTHTIEISAGELAILTVLVGGVTPYDLGLKLSSHGINSDGDKLNKIIRNLYSELSGAIRADEASSSLTGK